MAIFNVLDYGAIADDGQDDRLAIQAAIEAAAAAGGGEVYVPTGTYDVTGGDEEPSDGAIMMRDHVTLYGDGMGQTIIKLIDGWGTNGERADGKITGMIRTEYGEENHDIHLYDLTIDGNRDNTSGSVDGWFNGYIPGELGADYDITLERIEIKNMSKYGFDPHEQTINLVIRDTISHGNGLDGYVADYLIDSVYENNVAYNNDRHGFNIVTSTHDFQLIDSVAYDNGSTGVTIQRGSENIPSPYNILIQGGEFYNNFRAGIEVKMSDYVQLLDNEIYGNGREGIKINGSGFVDVDGNTLTGNSIANPGRYAEIYAVNYDDTGGVSGQLYDVVDVTISNNTITQGASSNNDAFKIASGLEPEITLTNNTLVGFGGTGPELLIGDAGDNLLKGGDFDDTLDGAAGQDTLEGGAGADQFIFSDATHSTETAYDRIRDFSVGEDIIDLSALAFTSLTSNASTLTGELRLAYSAGSDRTYVRSDQSTFEFFLEGDYRTTLSNSDFIFGELGSSTVATDGDDILVGTDGDDTLDGGLGADTLTGAAGGDLFRFSDKTHSVDTGFDVITDFTAGEDLIDVSTLGYTGFGTGNSGTLRISYSAGADLTHIRDDESPFEFALSGNHLSLEENSFGNILFADPSEGFPAFDFSAASITSWADQDTNPTTVDTPDATTLQLGGNTWKKVAQDYTITSNTMLSFDFRSTVEGEIHGIGFTDDNNYEITDVLKIFGTQDWGIDGPYYTGGGDWQRFHIDVSDFFASGTDVSYLTFVNDDDAASSADSWFRDVKLYELAGSGGGSTPTPYDFSSAAITPWSTQDTNPVSVEVLENTTLHLTGNTWKKVAQDYTITGDTMLSFDFRSTVEGEIQGIGFSDDNNYDASEVLQLFGTQAWGVDGPDYTGGGDWQSFEINVSDFFAIGTDVSYLTFINDDDANSLADSWFRDVTLYEAGDIVTDPDQLLVGTAADEKLVGGSGDDTIDGGAGKDTLTGGEGADTFRFSDATHSVDDNGANNNRYDSITDFVVGEDILDISGLGFTDLVEGGSTQAGELRLAYSANTDRTYVRSDQSDFEFFLQGDFTATLSDTDFIF